VTGGRATDDGHGLAGAGHGVAVGALRAADEQRRDCSAGTSGKLAVLERVGPLLVLWATERCASSRQAPYTRFRLAVELGHQW